MNPPRANGPVVPIAVLLSACAALWVALVLLFSAPLALTSSVSWGDALGFGASFWSLWLLFLPAVAWFSFRFPIERRSLLRTAALHVLACLVVVGASRVTFRALASVAPRPSRTAAPGNPSPSKLDRPGPPGFSPFRGLRGVLDVLVYWSLVGFCQAVTNLRTSQERERRAAELEARLTHAKLQALRMQINPHFLFNSLNSIAGLLYVNPRAADEMLGDLCLLLRRSLDSMEEQEIPLAQELHFIRGYVGIEQKRFGERLQLEIAVPEELSTAMVPALLLQPLVENAIRHGIEPRRGPGLISIEAGREDGRLHLVIRDNGRGFPARGSTTLPDAGGGIVRPGIGLANTEARLQALYGGEQSFSFGKADPEGCRVDIRIPFRLEAAGVPAVSDPVA